MNTPNLDEVRCNIDRINAQIVDLLIERMKYVDLVAEYKAANNLPIGDSKREQVILEKVSNLAGKEYEEDILPIFKSIFAASIQREERKINRENTI
jgi:monofunctional chorismate mutase